MKKGILTKQDRFRERVFPRNILIVACVIAALVAVITRLVTGSDYFGFVSLFALWAGLAAFGIVWAILTFFYVFGVRSRGRKAFHEVRTWVAILFLCLGVFLAVKLAIEM